MAFGLSPEAGRQAYVETSGIPFREQLELLFPGDHRNDEVASRFEETKRQNYFNWEVCTGAREILGYLRDRGTRIAVSSSNFPELVVGLLERRGLSVDLALGWRPDFSKGKDHFNYIQGKWDLEATDLVFVGDSLKDAARAAEAGVDFIAKAGLFSERDFLKSYPQIPVIYRLEELRNLL